MLFRGAVSNSTKGVRMTTPSCETSSPQRMATTLEQWEMALPWKATAVIRLLGASPTDYLGDMPHAVCRGCISGQSDYGMVSHR
jgi:hypothetical protein